MFKNYCNFNKKLYTFFIICFFLPITISAQDDILDSEPKSMINRSTEDQNQICNLAKSDASFDEGSALGYGIGGFLCGIFGWLFAELSNPEPPHTRLIGKDVNYVGTYASCYKNKAKSIRRTSACIGWGIGSTVSLIYILTLSK